MEHTSLEPSLADNLLDQLDRLVLDAEREDKPLELDPQRSRLFELFVMADAAGFLDPEAARDLSADGVCRALAGRWGLAEAARDSVSRQAKLPAEHLARMRLLWSLMRMWMEWTYAWQRWPEFHRSEA
ncbi:MAG TPA: hypothetical protein VML55_16720 [Planctomycetaceae bacterium]|nr:hypothetical protein [Planctomycetaceae bacterium]